MSKLRNYESDILQLETKYDRYTVSRIIENSFDDLLEVEVPSGIPNNFFVEINLYSYANNQLVFNTTVYNSQTAGIFNVTTLQYSDSSVRRLMFVDFSKILDPFPDGRFELVLNFFVPEIGSNEAKPLVLNTISPSRTEVELKLTPEYRTTLSASQLVNFASPEISREWVLEALKYICNQTQSLNTNIPTDQTVLSFDILQEFLPTSESIKLNNPNIDGLYTESVKRSTQDILNKTYTRASASIQTYPAQQLRFTDKMLVNIISSSLSQVMLQQGTTQNFTLL